MLDAAAEELAGILVLAVLVLRSIQTALLVQTEARHLVEVVAEGALEILRIQLSTREVVAERVFWGPGQAALAVRVFTKAVRPV